MSNHTRRNTPAIVTMLFVAAISAACNKTAPECGSPEVTALVSSITSDDQFASLSASLKAQASQEVTFTVRDVLKGKLEQDGARRTCAATLVATFSPRTKEGVDGVLAGNSAIVFNLLKGVLAVSALGLIGSVQGGDQNVTDKLQLLQEITNLYKAMDASDLAQLQQRWNPSTRTLSIPIEYSVDLLEDTSRFWVQTSGSEDLGRLKFIALLAADAIAAEPPAKSTTASPAKTAQSAATDVTARQQAADEEQQRVTAAEESARAAAADAEQIALERAKAAGAELRTLFGMIACDFIASSHCRIGSSGAWFNPAETTGKRLLGSCPDGTACRVDGWVLPTQEVVVVDKARPL